MSKQISDDQLIQEIKVEIDDYEKKFSNFPEGCKTEVRWDTVKRLHALSTETLKLRQEVERLKSNQKDNYTKIQNLKEELQSLAEKAELGQAILGMPPDWTLYHISYHDAPGGFWLYQEPGVATGTGRSGTAPTPLEAIQATTNQEELSETRSV